MIPLRIGPSARIQGVALGTVALGTEVCRFSAGIAIPGLN